MTGQGMSSTFKGGRPEADDAEDDAEAFWTLQDLRVLNELRKPVAIVVSGVYEDPHSPGGLQDYARALFQNRACKKQFGLPRLQAESAEIYKAYPEDKKQERRGWLLKCFQGNDSHQSWLNISDFLMPLFQGIKPDGHNFVCQVDSKAIKVRTGPQQVETALMHTVDLDSSVTALRVDAMHHRNPLHTFMFDSQGVLLNANGSAMAAFKHSEAEHPGRGGLSLRSLFDEGVYPGGEEEAQAAYDEAVNAVFALQLECHRHTQPHRSKKDGSTKFYMIEMWPMLDPVDASPAVLVKRYNITQQKHLELQLTAHQDALQRQNQLLEQDSITMHEQQQRMQQEAEELAQRLEVILHDKFSHRHSGFDSDTPIDKALNFLQGCISGTAPPVQQALDLYNLLSESDTNLRQPVALETQLLQDQRMDSEVGRSMLQLLQGSFNKLTPAARQTSALPSDMPRPLYGRAARSTDQQSSDADCFVEPLLTTQVERFLQDAENNWQFDIFAFAEITPGNTLSLLVYHFYKIAGLMEHYHFDPAKFWCFIQKIEAGYDMNNPYHNSIHVASVVQMTHMLVIHGGIMKSRAFTRVHLLSAYWSAAVHDFEHGGLNNDFLIKTAHPLAITYNDISPLENHHLSAAIRVLFIPECAYIPMAMLRSDELTQLRSTCINMVLGTDMKKHFDIISRFQAAFKRNPSSDPGEALAGAPKCAVEDWDGIKAEDKTLVHQMVLKCADIGHLAAGLKTHKRWAYQLEEEFFRQGDKEKAFGLPVSPLMDRSLQGGMTRSQMGFFNIVGTPMFKALVELFPEAQPILDGVNANYNQWAEAAQAASNTT